MALLMPDVAVRRKRKSFENFWLRALRGDNNDSTNSDLIQEKAATSNVSSWRSSRTIRREELESVEEADSVKPPTPAPDRTAADNQQHRQQQQQPEAPPPVEARGHAVKARPRSLRRVGLPTPPTSQRQQKQQAHQQPRYVTRVQGPTLGFVLDRIRQNEGDVRELDFSNLSSRNKRLEPYGGVLVARVLTCNHTVTRLVLRDHAIGDRGAVALANMLRFNTTLEYVDLYSNDISDAGAEALAKALYGHASLTHLSLWSNAISNRGARAFAEALKCNRTLKYLGLVHNRITGEGAQALLDALDVNTHLETLNLATNRIPHSITSQIRVSLARNRVEAPRVSLTMKTAEADVKKRLEELRRRAHSSDDDDAGSDASGFMSCSATDTDDEAEGEEEDDDGGVWI